MQVGNHLFPNQRQEVAMWQKERTQIRHCLPILEDASLLSTLREETGESESMPPKDAHTQKQHSLEM